MYVEVLTQTAVLAVFAVAAFQKGRSRAHFLSFVASLRALGLDRLSRITASAVLATEMAVVALLAWPSTVLAGHLLALALLTIFVAGAGRAARSATPVICRCFGAGGTPLAVRHVIRNALLALLAGAGLAAGRYAATTPASPGGAGLAVVGGLILALVFIRWEDLAYLVSPPRA